jgi:predicted Holliday junction resolvase-like endonuclease
MGEIVTHALSCPVGCDRVKRFAGDIRLMAGIEWIIILILFIVLGILLLLYILQERNIESRAREIFEAWREQERQDLAGWKATELERLSEEKARILFAGWRAEEEEIIRSDAVRRSQSVTRGKITEHLIPYFPDFPYNPKDARFLGSPVDLIVFDGLSEDTIREIVFVEIKTAKNPSLSRREREIRDCVQEKRVSYKLLQLVPETEG